MSLTQFVKRPAIKEAFKALATFERTPASLRGRPLLVPDVGGPNYLAGTAFDYLARMQIGLELRNTGVKVHERKWIAEQQTGRLDLDSPDDERYWLQTISEARLEYVNYLSGSGDLRRLADLCQNLAHADLLVRTLDGFDRSFRPIPKVSDEILRLLDVFASMNLLTSCRVCILNPIFVASSSVSGADADLVIDNRLIDFKTTTKPSVSLHNLLQLAGYAVLQRMGGIELTDGVYDTPFESVEIYFARYGQLARWQLAELFPYDCFARFCDAFEAEIASIEREREVASQQYELRRVERERQQQFDDDVARIRKAKTPRSLLRLLAQHERDLGIIDARSFHAPIFSAMRQMVRAGGASKKRYRTCTDVAAEIMTIETTTDPLELVRIFRRNEARLIRLSGNSHADATGDALIRRALLRTAGRVVKNRKSRKHG